MTPQNTALQEELFATLDKVPDFSPNTLTLYIRLWQLETWLRHIVYVELSAKYGHQWRKKIVANSVERARENDKRLTHMSSIEEMDISFVSFGALIKTISAEWQLFEAFLLPQKIWEARIEEIEQIRHRVAHFRVNLKDDLQRVIQLLRDIDQNIWEFCVSFNDVSSRPPFSNDINDPVIDKFSFINPYTPKFGSGNIPSRFDRLVDKVEISIKAVKRPWTTALPTTSISGLEGWIYDVDLHCYNNWLFDYNEFLRGIKAINKDIVYALLGPTIRHMRIMLPAVIGQDKAIDLITWILEVTNEAITLFNQLPQDHSEAIVLMKRIADSSPENILEPLHPINILHSDMPCSILDV